MRKLLRKMRIYDNQKREAHLGFLALLTQPGRLRSQLFSLWRARHRIPVFFATLVLQHRRGRLCHTFVPGATAEVAEDGTPFQTRLSFKPDGKRAIVCCERKIQRKKECGRRYQGAAPTGGTAYVNYIDERIREKFRENRKLT